MEAESGDSSADSWIFALRVLALGTLVGAIGILMVATLMSR